MAGWVLAILLVLSAAILYGLALIAVALYRGKCPACGRRGLKMHDFIRATIVVNGQRAPDSWAYYVCELCGARFKEHRGSMTFTDPGEST